MQTGEDAQRACGAAEVTSQTSLLDSGVEWQPDPDLARSNTGADVVLHIHLGCRMVGVAAGQGGRVVPGVCGPVAGIQPGIAVVIHDIGLVETALHSGHDETLCHRNRDRDNFSGQRYAEISDEILPLSINDARFPIEVETVVPIVVDEI